MTKPLLLIMAKAPRMGAGKTRLARDVGPVEAWRINRLMQAAAMRAACDPRWSARLLVGGADELRLPLPGVWPPPSRLARGLQGPGDLGVRLARAFRAAGSAPVGVIGSDCPQLTAAALAEGFAQLRRAPFVVGPALDGGFWFFAARRGVEAAAAFAHVRWSSPNACADLRLALPAPCALARTLADVDDGAAWAQLRRSSARYRAGLPEASASSSGAGAPAFERQRPKKASTRSA